MLRAIAEKREARKEMPAAEHVERQVAVAVVIAVKEPAFLVAVQRVVGRVEVEHDLARRFLMGVEKQLDEQPLDRRSIVVDLVIARPLRLARRMLQTVQRALARQRRRRLGLAAVTAFSQFRVGPPCLFFQTSRGHAARLSRPCRTWLHVKQIFSKTGRGRKALCRTRHVAQNVVSQAERAARLRQH